MTDAWTGRKYRGKYTGETYEVLSEPIEWNGKKYVSYAYNGSAVPSGHEQVTEFENGSNYTRIIEPKFAVGDVVTEDFDRYRIIGVSSEPDGENDFAYLGKVTEGSSITILWQSQISKVSQ